MIIIRADGNTEIGTGHIMRCLSIADAARQKGIECCFVIADESMAKVISEKGFGFRALGTIYTDMNAELEKFNEIIEELKPEIILVDSYFVTEKYLSAIGRKTKTAYIDDMHEFAYPVDIVINYNIHADKKRYTCLYNQSNIKLPDMHLGPYYAPLREEFSRISNRIIKNKVENVLVLTGGSDNENFALNLVKKICENNMTDYFFNIVVGRFSNSYDELCKYAEKMPNIKLYSNVTNMSELMMYNDIAISASGTTLYELCACGLPTITYILADNQIEISIEFSDKGIMESVGDIRKKSDCINSLLDMIVSYSSDYNKRKYLSEIMQQTVNKSGAAAIIENIFNTMEA